MCIIIIDTNLRNLNQGSSNLISKLSKFMIDFVIDFITSDTHLNLNQGIVGVVITVDDYYGHFD